MKTKLCTYALVVMIVLVAGSSVAEAVVSFSPRISISEEYTDNVFRSESKEVEEYITTISPGFTLDVREKRSGFELSYDPSYAVYAEDTNGDIWRHKANFTGFFDLTRNTQLKFSDSFLRTEEPITEEQYWDAVLVDIGVIIPEAYKSFRVGREAYYTNDAKLSLVHQFGEDNKLSLSYLHGLREEDETDGNDNKRHTPRVDLTYWFSPRIGIKANFIYTRGEFDLSEDFDDLDGRMRLNTKFTRHVKTYVAYRHVVREFDGTARDDYTIHKPSAGISIELAEGMSFDLGVGYFIQDQDGGEDEEGMVLDASIDKIWTFQRGKVHLSGLSGLDRNEFGTDNLGLERYYGVRCNATYAFTRRLNGEIKGFFRRNDYLNTVEEREDDRASIEAGLTFTPSTWFMISANLSHGVLRSDLKEEEYDENKASIRVTLYPRTPYRFFR